MLAILHALGMLVADLFKSRRRLEAENLLLRHQLTIALRRAPPRLRLLGSDRALLVWITWLWPSLLDAVQVVEPETILRWHRAGFKMFWRWKARHRAGRPRIDPQSSMPNGISSACCARVNVPTVEKTAESSFFGLPRPAEKPSSGSVRTGSPGVSA